MSSDKLALRSIWVVFAGLSVSCASGGSGDGAGEETAVASSTTSDSSASASASSTTSTSSGGSGSGGSNVTTRGVTSGGEDSTSSNTTTGSGGGATVSSTTGASSTTGSGCGMDECAPPSGYVAHACKLRFMYGINYAWHAFAGDFGGISMWQQSGVAGDAAQVSGELRDMAEHGVSVVRWWVWPDFRGDGVSFNGNSATGLGGTAEADLQRALELAEEHDLYLMLTLFSFDGFRGGNGPNLANIVTQDSAREALVENAVRPFAAVAESSPHKERLIAWDVINEPEWAMQGPSPYGDDPYEPSDGLSAVNHAEMETFVADVIEGLRQESSALTTVGGAALKWRRAWSNVDIDFYQFHIYDWINDNWPYDESPASYGVDDKPVVMGEFPVDGLSGVPYQTMLQSWYENGYSGALGWSVTDANFNWNSAKSDVRDFAEQYACETSY